MDWNDIFKLPSEALMGDKRIPKTTLVSMAHLTKHEQKILDKVKRIGHFATIQKNTTRIPPHVDEDRDIRSLIFLECEMAASSEAYAEVADLLHKSFPNPTVILGENGRRRAISASITRKSLDEKGAMVIERVERTKPFTIDDESIIPFLEALSFDRTDQTDLLAYLQDTAWKIRLSRSMNAVGFYPTCRECDREALLLLVSRIDSLQTRIDEARSLQQNGDLTPNDKARLRMELKRLGNEYDETATAIKESCNGGRD